MADRIDFANLIWQIADLLRGPYRPPQYERVMLPMTVLRRFDCVLAATKAKVLAEHERLKDRLEGAALEARLDAAAGQRFHNRSPLDFGRLKGDPDGVARHLAGYIRCFSANVRGIFEYFEFENEIERMNEANILYLVVSRFCDVDLHPARVPNSQMGLIFENLIRRFNELANETAGDHFTPREVIRLMVSILFIDDDALLATPGTARTLLDPACGTGGMLAEAQNYLRDHHPEARLFVYGQDYNKRAFATAASDMLMKQVDHNGDGDNIRFGDSFIEDSFDDRTFDYFLTNPPFGVDWKKQRNEVRREHEKDGFAGRFGAGLPRVSDGSLLFLQHMIAKFERVAPHEHKHGSRLAIVFSGSPLFAGGAGSGESEIRRWIIENDWLEAIVALPEQMFYNTGIGAYVWIVTNRKERRRRGKVQLVDARDVWTAGGGPESKRSLGDKRRHIAGNQIDEIVRLYGRFEDGERSRLFDNADFGYTRVTVERPLRLRYRMTTDDKARLLDACPHLLDDVQAIDEALGREPMRDWNAVQNRVRNLLRERGSRWTQKERKLFRDVFTRKDPEAEPVSAGGRAGGWEPDPALRDFENVPLKQDIDAYFEREVRPHLPDAWMDREKDKVGYEIAFNRHFHKYTPPRPLEEIDADLKAAEEEIVRLLQEATSVGVSGEADATVSPTQRKLKYVAGINDEVLGEDTDPDFEILYIDIGNVESSGKIAEASAYRFEDAPSRARRRVRDGDVIISTVRTYLQAIAQVQNPPENMIASTGFAVVRPLSEFDANYCKYALREQQFLSEVEKRSGGVNYPAINAIDLANIPVHTHPLAQQRAIADYLDRETRRLDELAARTRETIALLKERRAALIVAAVTGQIDVENTA